MYRIPLVSTLILVVLVGLAGCDTDPERGDTLGPVDPPDPIPASRYVGAVQGEGADGSYVADAEMPDGTDDAPVVTGGRWFVEGASMVMTVTVEDTATELYVSASRADIGYYRVAIPAARAVDAEDSPAAQRRAKRRAVGVESPVSAAIESPRDVTVRLTPAEGATSFSVMVAASDGTNITSRSTHSVQRANAAGSSELQFSLNWIHDIDLDLHVTVPGGERIYFGNLVGEQGGELDLDSNPNCNIDGINNENVTWGSTSPVAGEYVVVLDTWSACDIQGPFPYLISVTVAGETSVYEGTIDPGDLDGGRDREITRVTVGN